MPFIMLPTVDCVEESAKSALPATGHSPSTEECQTPNSIFTRFSAKPDLLGKDLTPPAQQCRQQQQRRQTESDQDGVCDLNRYSSPRSPQNQERVQISIDTNPASELLAPLLLSPFSEMPMAPAKTNSSLTTSTAADVLFLGRTQISFVTLIRQLSHVTCQAGTVFRRLTTDIDKICEQSQRLKSRLQVLQTHADTLLGKKAPKTSSPVGLVRYTNVKNHFRSVAKHENEDKDRGCRLFTPLTRSPVIVSLYEAADKDPAKKATRSPNSPAVEHCATQTDDIRPSGAIQSSIRRGVTLAVVPLKDDKESSVKLVFHSSSTTNLLRQEPASGLDSGLRYHLQQQEERSTGGQFGHGIDARAAPKIAYTDEIPTLRSSGQKYASEGDEATNSSAIRSTQFTTATADTSAGPATVIAIDTSAFQRTSKARKSSQYGEIVRRPVTAEKNPIQKATEQAIVKQRTTNSGRHSRSARRNTVVGFDVDTISCEKAASMTHCDRLGISDCAEEVGNRKQDFSSPVIGTTGDSIANEVVYEFAPFYRRKSKRLLAAGNIFSSLRRLKKDKRIISPPVAVSTPIKSATIKDEPVEYSSLHCSTKNEMSSSVHSDSAVGDGVCDRSAQEKGSSAIKGLKQFFQRSASLRRSKKEKTNSLNVTVPQYGYVSSPPPLPPRIRVSARGEEGIKSADEDDPENRSTSSSLGFQRNYVWRPRTNLPISTNSQVIDLASQLRDRPAFLPATVIGTENDQRFSKLSSSSSRDSAYSSCGKKLRQPSINSLASLDFTESKVNGWYRQGYQLEYPDECVREAAQHRQSPPEKAIIHASTPAKTPSVTKSRPGLQTASRDASNSSPHSDVSSFVDSNFSCDREGYFTTMHRDCGLSRKMYAKRGDIPVEERKVLIVPPSVHDAEGGSDTSLNTVTDPLQDAVIGRGQKSAPAPIGDRNRCPGTKPRPADLSLPPSVPTMYPAASPGPMSAASEAEVKFDLWLMSKFHAEQRMQQFRRQQRSLEGPVHSPSPRSDANQGNRFFARSFGRFSLPRSRRDSNGQKNKNDYVVEYLQSLGYGENELSCQKQQSIPRSPSNGDHSCTMPRKTVRFCE